MADKSKPGESGGGETDPSPGYTKTPNIRFDNWARQMKTRAEILCVDAIIRHTFGWHRHETKGLTIEEFQSLTGLSRPSVVKGLQDARDHGIAERVQVALGERGHTFAYRLIMRPEFKLLEPVADCGLQGVLPFEVVKFPGVDEVKELNSVKKSTKFRILTASGGHGVKKLNSVESSPIYVKEKIRRKKKSHTRKAVENSRRVPAKASSKAAVCESFIPQSRFDKPTLRRYAWAQHNFTSAVDEYLRQDRSEDGHRIKGTWRSTFEGIKNPGGWATIALRTGEHDDDVQKWLDNPSMFDYEKWRYGT